MPNPTWPEQPKPEQPKTNGQHDASKYVDGKFVDVVIGDDNVLICGHEIKRKTWNVDVATWRRQWEFLRKKLAKRGPMKTANVHGSDMDAFRRLVEWSGE